MLKLQPWKCKKSLTEYCCLVAVICFCAFSDTLAAPIHLTVQPKGTNQVELILSPVLPDVPYEVLARTNGAEGHWIKFAGPFGTTNKTVSGTFDLSAISGLTLNTLKNWTFVAGRWDGTPGYDLPPLYKELVLRIDPFDSGEPEGNLMGDGWSNIQKLNNNMDPFSWCTPPAPQLNVQFSGDLNARKGSAILTWQVLYGTVPDYFLIARADRTLRPMTNNPNYASRPSQVRPDRFGTNYPPQYRRPPRRENPVITGPFELAARIPGQAGVRDYRYVETNVDTLFSPLYKISAHYSPPLHARLDHVNAKAIRETILSVTAKQSTNGYELTTLNPVPYAWYLLLVRDKNDPQWRASGYFESGTNRNPVHLQVDKKGMMSVGQSPIAMPAVKHQPDVAGPEFAAGWGEDSDGDGLPDIYEVLVTKTEPDEADTGNTGVLDGYKEMTADGWSNLEKFRRRSNPLKPAHPPATVELRKPTGIEIMKAISPQSDLCYELLLEIKTNDTAGFQPAEQFPELFSRMVNYRQPNEHKNFDLRVSWKYSSLLAEGYDRLERSQVATDYQAVESLRQKTSVKLFEAFATNLMINPPLCRNDASNRAAAIEHAYRNGEMDKEVAMAELMTLQDNQSLDFYGKVIDQFGQPVVGAEVTAQIGLSMGAGSTHKAQTDANGYFQFTGLRGHSLNLVPQKNGYQMEGHGIKGPNGPETSSNDRGIYAMWKLKGPEPMIHNDLYNNKIQPDGRTYMIDFQKNQISEGTNSPGDMLVQIQRPPQIKPREKFDWSFVMTAIDGGFIEVTNDVYLNEAPEKGYQPQYEMKRYATNVINYASWPTFRTDRTFYLKSRGGKVYGHFQIKELEPDYRGMAAIRIESYVNPAGSRNLEFETSKQIR